MAHGPMAPAPARSKKNRRSGAARNAPRAGSVRLAQRERMLRAAVRCAYEEGIASITVASVTACAGVSRKTFYDEFEDREDCLACAVEEAFAAARLRVAPACAAGSSWAAAIRAGLGALLELFHHEPAMARLCVVDSLCAGRAALELRAEILSELALLVDRGRELARREPLPLTAEGVVGGALELLRERLSRPGGPPLTEMLNPLMAFIVLPYLGATAARRELAHPQLDPGPAQPQSRADPLEGLNMRLTHRTIRALAAVGENPGISNMRFSQLVGIADQGQASKLLARLKRLELVENTAAGQPKGSPNAWQLTDRGAELDRHLRSASWAGV